MAPHFGPAQSSSQGCFSQCTWHSPGASVDQIPPPALSPLATSDFGGRCGWTSEESHTFVATDSALACATAADCVKRLSPTCRSAHARTHAQTHMCARARTNARIDTRVRTHARTQVVGCLAATAAQQACVLALSAGPRLAVGGSWRSASTRTSRSRFSDGYPAPGLAHICAGTGPTSAPGLAAHLRRD